MSDAPEWEMIEAGWHCYRRNFQNPLGAVCFESDRRWHCYVGSNASVTNFATLKEAKQYIEGQTKCA